MNMPLRSTPWRRWQRWHAQWPTLLALIVWVIFAGYVLRFRSQCVRRPGVVVYAPLVCIAPSAVLK